MGFSTTFAMLTFLMVFAGMSVAVISMQESITAAATAVKTQQEEATQATQQEISITNTNYAYAELRDWTTTYNDEINDGTHTNTTAQADSIQLAASNTSGTYTSKAYNTGHTSNYTTISWNSIEPAGSSLALHVRSANTTADLQAAAFIGPDGTSTSNYTTTGTSLHASHDQDRIIQYRATLKTNASTPELADVTIGVRREVGHATLQIQNTGKQKLKPHHTDAYIDGVRALRNATDRVYTLENQLDERLWNPGEELNLTVFTNISTSKTITIVNDHARDQAAVTN